MNRRLIAPALVLGLLSQPALAEESKPPSNVSRTIVLQLETKDPLISYAVGLVPFYSYSAAQYAGTSRYNARVPEDLSGSALIQTLTDLGLLIGASAMAASSRTNSGSAVLALLLYATIPVSHAWMYAPYWADVTANRNRNAAKAAGFGDPEDGEN